MERYKITYLKEKISQEKNFISEEDYRDIVEMKNKKSDLEEKLREINKKKKPGEYESVSNQIKKLGEKISSFGDWFRPNSPLGKALEEGIDLILPSYKGDDSMIQIPVKFEKI